MESPANIIPRKLESVSLQMEIFSEIRRRLGVGRRVSTFARLASRPPFSGRAQGDAGRPLAEETP